MLKFYFQFTYLSSLTFSLQRSAEKSHFTCPTRSRAAVQPGVAGCSRSTQPCRFAPFLPRGRSTRTTKGLIRESCSSPFKRCTMHMYWHRLVAVCVFFFFFLQPHRSPKQFRRTMMKQRCWMQPLLDKSRLQLQSPTLANLLKVSKIVLQTFFWPKFAFLCLCVELLTEIYHLTEPSKWKHATCHFHYCQRNNHPLNLPPLCYLNLHSAIGMLSYS